MKSLKTFFESKAAWLGVLLVASLGSGCLTGKSSTSSELFNGKDLNNWTQNKAGGWEAKDGILGPSAKPGGYIWAKGKYDNFELELDFKMSKRCNSGVDGTTVTSPSGVTYKKCPTGSTSDQMAVTATYQLPPFVCAQTCDQNPACTAYAVDSAQQNCYIGGPTGPGANFTMYFRVPGL